MGCQKLTYYNQNLALVWTKNQAKNQQNFGHSFGMLMPGRQSTSESYRYGFQGQERDDEIKGNGNSLNYKYRMHDPRLGRFFAVDPLTWKYPFYTPYSFSGNRVIDKIELEGKEPTETRLFWNLVPEIKQALWGDLKQTNIYVTNGLHSNTPFFGNFGEDMLVAEVWYDGGESIGVVSDYYFFDKGLNKWVKFDPTDIGWSAEDATLIATAGITLAVGGILLNEVSVVASSAIKKGLNRQIY